MESKLMKKKMRSQIGSYGWALLIYYLIMNVCVIAAMLLQMVAHMVGQMLQGNYSMELELDEAALMGNGWGYLLACVMAVAFIRLWKGKAFFKGMWKTEKKMTGGAFWQLVCVFISAQLAFQICATFQELMLNQFDLSVLEAMELATANSDTISMFLYLALGAPVVEEIIFRGLVLRGLEPYGKRFAILVSAILFGLFHGNIVQSPYAFVVGLVLGYVAMEYSILWAMVLHMLNNLILGDTLTRLTQWLGEEGSAMVTQGVILICAAGALVSLIVNRKRVMEYHRNNPLNWDSWIVYCSAPGCIILFLFMELNAISMLFM